MMSDEDFKEIVNIDLKRNASRQSRRISPAVSTALRQPEHRERWLAMLVRILMSADDQLASRENDHYRKMAELGKQLVRANMALRAGPDPQLDRQQASLRGRIADQKVEFWTHRSKTLKFRSVVMSAIHDARRICGHPAGDVLAEHEIALHRTRVRLLEDSIRLHRRLVLTDLSPDEEADEIDLDLWALLPDEE